MENLLHRTYLCIRIIEDICDEDCPRINTLDKILLAQAETSNDSKQHNKTKPPTLHLNYLILDTAVLTVDEGKCRQVMECDSVFTLTGSDSKCSVIKDTMCMLC